MADPTKETCPNFQADFFADIWNDLIQASGQTKNKIIHRLTQSWTLDHERRVNEWIEEQEANARIAAEADRVRAAQEEEAQRLLDAEKEKELLKAEKKKPKMNGFDGTLSVSDILIPRPAQYAVQKLNNFEYGTSPLMGAKMLRATPVP